MRNVIRKIGESGVATQDHGAGSKQDLDLAVNTRITVHHGHETNGSLKNHPFKSANLRAATEGLTHQHPATPLGASGQVFGRPAPQCHRGNSGHEQTMSIAMPSALPSCHHQALARAETDSSPRHRCADHDPNAGRQPAHPGNASVPGGYRAVAGPVRLPAIATTTVRASVEPA